MGLWLGRGAGGVTVNVFATSTARVTHPAARIYRSHIGLKPLSLLRRLIHSCWDSDPLLHTDEGFSCGRIRANAPQVCRLRLCPQANAKAPELPLRGASGTGGVAQGHSSHLVARRAAGQRGGKSPPTALSVAAPYHFGTRGRPSGRPLAQSL